MPKPIVIFMILIISIFMSGCSQDNSDIIIGNWSSDQISQKVGTDEELSHFNYLEISNNEVALKSFILLSQDGATVRKFDEREMIIHYEMKEKDQILLNNKVYEIELKKSEMTIKNENVEIQYTRENK